MFDVPHVLQLTCDRPLIRQCQGTCIILRTVSKPPDVDEIIIDDIAIEFDNCLLDSKPWPAFAFLHHALLTARLRCTTIRIELGINWAGCKVMRDGFNMMIQHTKQRVEVVLFGDASFGPQRWS